MVLLGYPIAPHRSFDIPFHGWPLWSANIHTDNGTAAGLGWLALDDLQQWPYKTRRHRETAAGCCKF